MAVDISFLGKGRCHVLLLPQTEIIQDRHEGNGKENGIGSAFGYIVTIRFIH